MTRFCNAAAIMALLAARAAPAAPIEISVNPAASSVSVEFCTSGACDSDVSPTAGFIELKLDALDAPTEVAVHDFSLSLTQTIDLFINFGITGSITATGQNVRLDDGAPGIPLPAAVLDAGGAFGYVGVPAISTGIVNYTAAGLPCLLLSGAGLPCTDTIVLADQGVQSGNFDGVVAVLPGRVVQLTMMPDVSGPINPDNPSLGTLTIAGTLVGEATVPLPGDANLDDEVNGADVQAFVDILLEPAAYGWRERYAADMDDDDQFTAEDAALMVDCLVSGACPD